MTQGFALYLYPNEKAEHWCAVLDALEWNTRVFSTFERSKSVPKLHKVFCEMSKTGIYFDTIEWDRPAVFVRDTVEVEVLDDSGQPEIRTVKSWGNGGKSETQIKAKLISMLTTFRELLGNGDIKLESDGITCEDVSELIAHIQSEELVDNGCRPDTAWW